MSIDNPMQDIGLVGCLTQREVFNGSSIWRAIPMPHDKSLLELQNIDPKFTSDMYGQAIRDFIDGKINESLMWRVMGTRKGIYVSP